MHYHLAPLAGNGVTNLWVVLLQLVEDCLKVELGVVGVCHNWTVVSSCLDKSWLHPISV